MKKLQLGAFDQGLEGWVNTDITPHLVVAKIPGLVHLLRGVRLLPEHRFRQHREGIFAKLRYLNVTRRFPFRDATFDCVYSSHMLEHLDPRDANHCLKESRRVLKQGGVLRVAVPDLDQVVRAAGTPQSGLAALKHRQQLERYRRDEHPQHAPLQPSAQPSGRE